MAELHYPSTAEVQLRLGPNENAILTVVRRGAWWKHAQVEGRQAGTGLVSGIVLTAARADDSTIRMILFRSFRLTFPDEGGEGTPAASGEVTRFSRKDR